MARSTGKALCGLLNATRANYLDGTREEDLTRAEVACRKQAHALLHLLREHVPGFEDARLVETAAQVGVRETRCIEGEYVITEADCRAGRAFEDAILANSSLRQMVNAFQLGMVGGTAAALSVQEGVPPRELPYAILKPALVQAGLVFRDDMIA